MTTNLRVRFDGKVLVPEGPIDLPIGHLLEVHVADLDGSPRESTPLEQLAAVAKRFPAGQGKQSDRAAQHDHYLYGLPKRS